MFCAMQSLQCETCYSAVRVSVSGVDGIQCKGWVSIICYLEFSSLMACEKKLSLILLVRVLMLRYRLPDGSSEKSSWLRWQESLMIFRAFLTHR